AERIELKNLAGEAVRQLEQAGADRKDVVAIEEEVADLIDDDEFWRYQARSLALFFTPTRSTTYRLPHNLTSMAEVSHRFHLRPRPPPPTSPHTAVVLPLPRGGARLADTAPEQEPETVAFPALPRDVESGGDKSSIRARAPSRKIQGSEGQKTRMRQYARQID